MKLVAWAIVPVFLLPAVATSQQLFVGQQDAATAPPSAQKSSLTVKAGVDRVVVLGGKTYLHGIVKDAGSASGATSKQKASWSKQSGPGDVIFENVDSPITTATFSIPGEYTLRLSACAH